MHGIRHFQRIDFKSLVSVALFIRFMPENTKKIASKVSKKLAHFDKYEKKNSKKCPLNSARTIKVAIENLGHTNYALAQCTKCSKCDTTQMPMVSSLSARRLLYCALRRTWAAFYFELISVLMLTWPTAAAFVCMIIAGIFIGSAVIIRAFEPFSARARVCV